MSSKVNEFGLTEVWCPPDPLVDVVFVHGLNGHPYNTWATQDVYWPRDLLPKDVDQERCRILTYGYDATVSAFRDGTSKDHIHHHAETLTARLAANRSRVRALERPLIFVVHSLGGLVLKRMLIHSNESTHVNQERLRSIFISTYGILFLGTPHNGSDLAKWGSMLQSICAAALPKKLFDSQSQLVKALETNNETLQLINRDFTAISSKFRIYFFHEAKPMDLKGTRQFVVDEDSAAPNLQGVERAGIERDHSHMCKFENENSPGYDLVSEAIQRYAGEAPMTIPGRWQAARRNQQLQKQDDVRELLGDDIPDLNPAIRDNSTHASKNTSMANSVSSVKLLEQSKSQISSGPLLVAPLGFRPNSIFKGFDIPLEWMDRKLKSESKAQMGSCAILLWGPPGCGKSHLARQYVYLHRNEHPAGTFWLDCKSSTSMIRDWFEIGRRIGCLDENNTNQLVSDVSFIHKVRQALEEQHGWLLVFDGILFASEIEIENFRHFLPDSQGNKIIYTSVNKTLARRQRLLVPSALRVPQLSKEAACEFLFASLNINVRRATPVQRQKANELVKYYSCLPLAIHAAAHALIARGRALERFQIGPTDNRLSQPILDIVQTLRDGTGNKGALALLTLLSFIYHRVPVVLLQFGAKFLADKGFDIESPNPDGRGRGHIDYTIAILIQRGLVERQLQPLSSSISDLDDSPDTSRKSTINNPYAPDAIPVVPSQIPQDSSGLEMILADERVEVESLQSLPTGIDTLRVQTVIQAVIRDEKKMNTSEFCQWLVLACQFLHSSYRKAKQRSMASGGHHASITDFYEYKTHAQALYRHYPSSEKQVPVAIFEARHHLRSLLREIDRAMRNQSPSQASDCGNHVYRSVFERSAGSSSEDGPDTPIHDLSRSTTWSMSRIEHDKVESPTEIHPRHANLDPYITDEDDGGYTTDIDDLRDLQTSKQWSIKSPLTSPTTFDNPSILEAVLRGNFPGRTKDLGEFKRLPMVAPVYEHAQSPPASTRKQGRRDSSSSSHAERALAALQAKSPSRKNTSRRSSDVPVQPQIFEEFVSTSKAGKFAPESQVENLPRMPLGERSTNVPIRVSPPLLPTRSHQRALSTSPRLLNAVLANQAMTSWNSELPVEENVIVTRRRPSAVPMMPVRIIESYIPVGASIPEGYYSSTAMSRDQSRESHHSIQSLPTRPTSAAGSPIPDVFGAYIPTQLDFGDNGTPGLGPTFEGNDFNRVFDITSPGGLPTSPVQSQLLPAPSGGNQFLNGLGVRNNGGMGGDNNTAV